MAVLFTPHFIQFFDSDGNPLSGGKLYTYEAGTTTPKATYTTSAATVENANPVVLDSAGRATVFIDGSYRFDLFDSNDVLVESTDNITNFTTTGTEEDSFFESFSGDGETVSFTLSEDQGTDEKILLIATEFEYSVNGDFSSDSDWTKGTGWSIGSGVATATGAISTDLEQDAGRSLVEGRLYTVTMTITRSAGSITPNIGGTAGTARSSSGTYTENIIAGDTQKITFSTSGFTGTIDNVSVREVDGIRPVSTADFTINDAALTFVDPPASGTNNILVWNYARLAGAASTSAASAATSAANAATSATTASNVENRLTGIASTSSVAIGTGTKSFTVASGLGFTAGQFVLIDSDADGANYMFGQVTSYSSTTLEVDVTVTGGSGTYADWTITIAGARGAIGPTGSVSATSGVTAATSAGASLISSGGANCLTWGSGGSANTTLGGNMSGASTHKLVNMPDPTAAQDYATKAYVDANSASFRGALVYHSTTQSIAHNTPQAVVFDSENYDTDAIHSTVTNTSRLTVPSGVTKVKLLFSTQFNLTTLTLYELVLRKNGSAVLNPILQARKNGNMAAADTIRMVSPVLDVSGGDYFEFFIKQQNGGSSAADAAGSGLTWASMEIME